MTGVSNISEIGHSHMSNYISWILMVTGDLTFLNALYVLEFIFF